MKTEKAGNRVVGYLRVSTQDQDTEKNKHDVREWAKSKGLGKVTFHEEKISGQKDWRKRKLGPIIDSMTPGSWLIVPEFSRLARSTQQVLEILAELKRKQVSVGVVKGNQVVNGSIESKVFYTMMALFSEIERDLISARTKEGLAARKALGVRLGRPPLSSKLEPHKQMIQSMLKQGKNKMEIALKLNCSLVTLYYFLKTRGINYKIQRGV